MLSIRSLLYDQVPLRAPLMFPGDGPIETRFFDLPANTWRCATRPGTSRPTSSTRSARSPITSLVTSGCRTWAPRPPRPWPWYRARASSVSSVARGTTVHEDLGRDTADKTASVHFLRFELEPEMRVALRGGAGLCAGIDHGAYRQALEPIPSQIRDALLSDLD